MSFTNILIPVDGSVHAKFACEIAVKRILSDGKGIVHLVHCFEPIPQLIHGPSREKLVEELEAGARVIFDDCIPLFEKANISYNTQTLYGNHGYLITEQAHKMGCEVIIMGTRGLGQVKGLVLGSISNAVLYHSEIPVLLVKAPQL